MAQPVQQQPDYRHDLHEVCSLRFQPCRRDGTTIEIHSAVFGPLRVSRCAAAVCCFGREGRCGELFVYQFRTDHEMPLHVLGRDDPVFADLCWNAYRMALQQEDREEIILLGNIFPVIMDL
jgi:hypothetical protein